MEQRQNFDPSTFGTILRMPEPFTVLCLGKSLPQSLRRPGSSRKSTRTRRHSKSFSTSKRNLENLLDTLRELREENAALKNRITKMEMQEDVGRYLNFEQQVNGYMLNKNGDKNGPYWSACWDRDRKLVRLHTNSLGTNCPIRHR
jgi:hypothetical protein